MNSKFVRKTGIALFATTILTAAPRTSSAFDPATAALVAGYLAKAYGIYQTALTLLNSAFGDSGPDLAAQLNQVEASILGALATQRNQMWKANAQTVFDNFQILAYRQNTDPDNYNLWSQTIELSKSTINLYAQMVDDVSNGISTDVDSNYQLAPMFNTLIATHVGLNKMKEEIQPNNWATWGENNIYLSRAMTVDYELIGAAHYMCWWANVGAGNYNPGLALAGRDGSSRDARARSQLWRKLNNHDVQVGSWTGLNSCTQNLQTIPEYCNPGTGTCTSVYDGPLDTALRCPNPNLVFPPADTGALLIAARNYAAPTWWDTDPVVQVVTSGMQGILTVGGGNSSDVSSVTLPVTGWMTDPQVYEPGCSNQGLDIPVAYPMLDTVPAPIPVSFSDGTQLQGDYTNIFPNNQVRLSSNSADLVSRSNPLLIRPSTTYSLVVRYSQPHSSSGTIKVGIQRGDTGATQYVFNNVTFSPTPSGDWQLKRLPFNTTSSWPGTQYYARLQYIGGQITYVDAVWVE